MCGCFLISDHCDVWLHSDLASAPSHPANARTARLPHPHDHPKGHPHMHPHCHPNALQWSLGCPKTTFFWNLLIFLDPSCIFMCRAGAKNLNLNTHKLIIITFDWGSY